MIFLSALAGLVISGTTDTTVLVHEEPGVGRYEFLIQLRYGTAINVKFKSNDKNPIVLRKAISTPQRYGFTLGDSIRPPLLIKRIAGRLRLFVIRDDLESGVYEYKSVLVGSLEVAKNKLLFTSSGTFEFSGQGSFMIERDKVYLWDASEVSRGHHAPHQYNLWQLLFESQFKKKLIGRTSRSYRFWSSSTDHPTVVPRKDDPLKEFNLRWRWWGNTK